MTNNNETIIKGDYFVKGVLGNLNVPIAPLLYFSLLIDSNTISGTVILSNPLYSEDIIIKDVVGTIHTTPYNVMVQIVNIKGTHRIYNYKSIEKESIKYFEAFIAIEKDWTGVGSFTYDHHTTENVTVYINNKYTLDGKISELKDFSDEFKFGYLSKHKNEK